MIIDCHGHYTTAPAAHTAWREQQVAAWEAGGGCPFASRSAFAVARCQTERPERRHVEGRSVACHRVEEIADQLQERAS